MKPTKVSVPSKRLLRFLKSQSDGQSFFTPSWTTSNVRHPGHEAPFKPCKMKSSSRKQATRAFGTATLPIESSLFRSDLLWPKQAKKSADYGTAKDLERSSKWPLFISPPQSRKQSYDHGREKKWWEHLGVMKRQKEALHADDLPRLAGFLEDNTLLGRATRPGNELKLRCTEFDEHGKITLTNGEFKKSELIAKYGLLPRDLRKIDSSLLPSILVRPSAILINLLHLRILIKHNRVLVFDAYGSTDSYTQSLFMYDLEGKLSSPEAQRTAASGSTLSTLPYEFRALEAILISVTTALEGEFEGVREPVVRVLRELEEDIDRDKLRHLLIYSKKLGTFEQKARLVRDALDDLLEADDDLAAMYLSEKTKGLKREEEDHTDIEMLLESYHKVCDEIVQVSGNLVSNIRNTEEITRAILDANRNSLMLLDLKFSIGTLGLGGGTFVAALYGMNLKNFIEESDLGFWGVSAWCTIVSTIVLVWGLKKLRGVQRVSMWGSLPGDTAQGKRGWSRIADQPAERAAVFARRERLRSVKELRERYDRNFEQEQVLADAKAKASQMHGSTASSPKAHDA